MSETMTETEADKPGELVLRVSAGSNASATASALAHAVYKGQSVLLRSIGAGAVNQAVKAMAIATSFVGPRGYSLTFRPYFDEVVLPDGSKVTAMVHKVIVS